MKNTAGKPMELTDGLIKELVDKSNLAWRENLHKAVRRFLGDLPPIVVDAIDAAYVAGMDDAKLCTKCQNPFESHHHRHITKNGIYHTRCYKKESR